jgi:hypothetical protein
MKLFISFLLLLFCFLNMICLPATALLREHHEISGGLGYHVQTSLKDRQGYAWQVVLFSEPQSSNSNSVIKYHLRLVGFPEIAEFMHPQPLQIITAKGKIFKAIDLISVSSPAPNVGEFDVSNVLPLLPKKGSLKLATILHDERNLSLSIPESILTEWQWLVK